SRPFLTSFDAEGGTALKAPAWPSPPGLDPDLWTSKGSCFDSTWTDPGARLSVAHAGLPSVGLDGRRAPRAVRDDGGHGLRGREPPQAERRLLGAEEECRPQRELREGRRHELEVGQGPRPHRRLRPGGA